MRWGASYGRLERTRTRRSNRGGRGGGHARLPPRRTRSASGADVGRRAHHDLYATVLRLAHAVFSGHQRITFAAPLDGDLVVRDAVASEVLRHCVGALHGQFAVIIGRTRTVRMTDDPDHSQPRFPRVLRGLTQHFGGTLGHRRAVPVEEYPVVAWDLPRLYLRDSRLLNATFDHLHGPHEAVPAPGDIAVLEAFLLLFHPAVKADLSPRHGTGCLIY